MSLAVSLRKSLVNSPPVAATVYAALLIVLVVVTISSVADILSQRSSVAATAAVLEQLEGRKAPAAGRGGEAGMPQGSAFLEGATVTVAGAALLQRVAAAVTKAGGNVLSSQLDIQGPNAKAGFVSMVANCEMDQSALQSMLYDLEAGMPFLFIDQLDIQVVSAGEGKLRFLLGVSGQWQGTK
jgi:general secretion pathway protein M